MATINAKAKAAQLEAARAEFNARKAAKAAATREKNKQAKAAIHAATVQPQPEHVNVEDLFAGIELPSPARVLVGFILGVVTAGVAGYGISMLAAYALAGIATLTGSALLAFMLSVAVWLLSMYAGWKVGKYIGCKVFESVVLPEGLASRSYESVAGATSRTKQRIGAWFSERPSINEFTGAFTRGEKVGVA